MPTLDKKLLDKLLEAAAADYGLDLATPHGLTAALLVANTLLQIENTRLLTSLDSKI